MEKPDIDEINLLKRQIEEERNKRIRAEQNLYYTNVMLNSSFAGMITVDISQRITYVNNAFLKLFGGNRTNYVGATLKEVIAWESADDIDTIIESIYAENGRKVHLKCKNRDGASLLIQFDGQVMLSSKGTPFQIVINFVDKTKDLQENDYQWLEIILRESELRFEKVFHQSPTGILLVEKNNPLKVKYVNQTFCDWTGYAQEDFFGNDDLMKNLRIRQVRDIGEAEENFKKQVSRYSHLFDTIVIRKNGNLLYTDLKTNELEYNGYTYQIQYFINVGERIKAADIITQCQNLLQTTQRSAKIGSIDVDFAGNQMSWSEETFYIFEIPLHNRIANSKIFFECILPEDAERVKKEIDDAISRKVGLDLTYRIFTPDKEVKHVCFNAHPVYHVENQSLRFVGTIQDISANVAWEEEIERIKTLNTANTQDNYLHKELENKVEYQNLLLQNISDAIIYLDKNWEIVDWNEGATDIYGWEKESVIGKQIDKICFTVYLQGYTPEIIIKELLQNGKWKGQIKQKTRFGKEITVQAFYRVIINSENEIVGFVMSNKNMTEFLQVQEQANKWEMTLQLIFENIPGWIMLQDRSLNIMGCNKNFVSAMGERNQSELIGRGYNDLPVSPEFAYQSYQSSLKVLMENQPLYHVTEPLISRNGKTYWLDTTKVPLRDTNGELMGVLVTAEDVTEKRAIEEQLKEKQANLTSIIENTDDLIWYIDKEHTFKAFNTVMYEKIKSAFGIKIQYGKNAMEILPEEYKIQWRQIHEYVMKGKKLVIEREIDLHNNRQMWLEFSCNPVVNDNEVTGACYIARDITERKENEKLLINTQLQQEKIKSLAIIQGQEDERRRVAMELHDGVGQILTALQMQVNYLKMQENLHAPEQELVPMAQLVDSAKQEVRRISYNLMPSVLNDFGIADAVQNLCTVMSHNTNIEIDADIDLNDIRFPSQIEIGIFRIAQEVINNAIKYSEADSIKVQLYDEETQIRLEITDNGKGFNVNEIARGNGLANLSQRANLLNGTLSIESEEGKGCKVTAVIPYLLDEVEDEAIIEF
ncbi:MAG: PAS domain S-box protein [Cytophagales bacterium]|nr:MAG: PAS domain S-box protein [Cytophagales bacterium]